MTPNMSFATCGNIVLVQVGHTRYEYVVDLGAFLRVYPKWRNRRPGQLLNWLKANNICWRREGEEWGSPS
jgi:hypothetical protein